MKGPRADLRVTSQLIDTKINPYNRVTSRWLSDKEPAYQCRRCRSYPCVGRPPGERNGYPLQHSCLGNPMNRGAWPATVHEVAKESNTT